MITLKEVQSPSSECPEIHEVSENGVLVGFVEKMQDSKAEMRPWYAYAKSNEVPGRIYVNHFYPDQKGKKFAMDMAIDALLTYVSGNK